MAPFNLEISDHAALRLKERRVTREQVRRCLAKGTLTAVDTNGRSIKRFAFKKRVLEVIYVERQLGFVIVTAYWRGEW